MSGLVGIIANDSARYSLFASCVTRLQVPEGTRLEWLIGGDWCGARNTLVDLVLGSDAEFLWFMDDDHAFPHDLLLRLLAHDLPLITPVCLQRTSPFLPVQFTAENEHAPGDGKYLPVYLPGFPDEGVIELVGGGCAGMLIRREVLEAIKPPWFEHTEVSEDLLFCEKAKAAGFSIHCDLSARLGHITTTVVWPAVRDDEWVVGLTVGRDMQLFVPMYGGKEIGVT